MSKISTHVLDVVLGKPAAGIAVRLEKHGGDGWTVLSESGTDAEGRCRDLADNLAQGTYRIAFGTGAYFERQGRPSIYPEIAVTFVCCGENHYHLPLLLSDNSYTTYRGS